MKKTLRNIVGGLGLLTLVAGCTPAGAVLMGSRDPGARVLGTFMYHGGRHQDRMEEQEAGRSQVNIYGNQQRDDKGKINDIQVKHNIYQNGKKGMKIHADFAIKNHKGIPIKIIAYFYHKNGEKLKDIDGQYKAYDGQVACQGSMIIPSSAHSHFSNVKIFMPDNQLDISQKGKYDLKFQLILFNYGTNPPKPISKSNWHYFTYTK